MKFIIAPPHSDASEIRFIRSQKKNAQLVYKDFIYNKKLSQVNGQTTWRCADVLKMRCKAVIITKGNELVTARREHNHADHKDRIGQRALYKEEEDLGVLEEFKCGSEGSTAQRQVTTITTTNAVKNAASTATGVGDATIATREQLISLHAHDSQRNIKEYKLFVPTEVSTGKQSQRQD